MKIALLVIVVYVLGVLLAVVWGNIHLPSVTRALEGRVPERMFRKIVVWLALFWPFGVVVYIASSLIKPFVWIAARLAPKTAKRMKAEMMEDIGITKPSDLMMDGGMDAINTGMQMAIAERVKQIEITLILHSGGARRVVFVKSEKVLALMLSRDPIRELLLSIASSDSDALEGLQ